MVNDKSNKKSNVSILKIIKRKLIMYQRYYINKRYQYKYLYNILHQLNNNHNNRGLIKSYYKLSYRYYYSYLIV